VGLEPTAHGLKIRLPQRAIDEPTTSNDSAEKTASTGLSLNPSNDPDLTAVLTSWLELPAEVRKIISGVVKATVQAKGKRR
jgi:hypothetical protein